MEPVTYRPIGTIRTPFTDIDGMPIQAAGAVGIRGRIELDAAYQAGLLDLDGFSHLILLYHLHEMRDARLTVTPFLDDMRHAIFATRSPARPNPIGLPTVRLLEVRGWTIEIADVDMLDGTPLLDMKPYVPALDDRPGASVGWYAGRLDRLADARSDRRFDPDPLASEAEASAD
jgi:tRNA-Thr(GGU) m(6)t(6)A37 methyltransferase TsaA